MSPRTRIPDWLLERYVLGELDEARAAETRRLLEADPDGAARIAAIQASNREILARYPAPRMAGEIRERAGVRPPQARRSTWLWAVPALAAAAAVAVAVLPGTPAPGPVGPVPVETTRPKGLQPTLEVLRKAGAGEERLASGAVTAPGDVVQLGYIAGGASHGVVLGIDGAGAAQLLHPLDPTASTALSATEGRVVLPYALELDGAAAFDRFVFVAGTAPIDVSQVLQAARAVAARPEGAREAALALPTGLAQDSVVLEHPR